MIHYGMVASEEDMETIRGLFREYAQSLDFDLDFQDFEKELLKLPGYYDRPEGRLILALEEDRPAGCVALRKINDEICELKRLFVRREFRGLGIGKGLMDWIIKEAKDIGYRKMRLDTIETMEEAIELYKRYGFYEIEAYIYNPLEGALYMELCL